MNKRELKSVIKEMVRESLTEIFAEMHLETIIEGVVKKNGSSSFSRQVAKVPSAPASPVPSINTKAMLRERLGVDESEWRSMYEGIEIDNPIITGEVAEEPEQVPEEILQQIGLFKDYSKFL